MAKKKKLAEMGEGLNVWEVIACLLEDEGAWGKDLPRDMNPWQASQALLTLIQVGSHPEDQKQRLLLAVIKNAAINADGAECCALAAQIVRQLEGQTLLQKAIAKEQNKERRNNLGDLQAKLLSL
jgi:hypothetical protein